MRARVISAQLRYDQLDEAQHVYQETLLPLVQQFVGFKGSWLLIDANTCQGMLITLWANDADLRASEANGVYQMQLQQIAHLCANTPAHAVYEAA